MAIQTFTAVKVAQFLIKNGINATAESEATMEVDGEVSITDRIGIQVGESYILIKEIDNPKSTFDTMYHHEEFDRLEDPFLIKLRKVIANPFWFDSGRKNPNGESRSS